MEPGNPYSPPGSQLSAPPYASALPPDSVSASILENLRGTRPWVRFLSILGFIFSALMIVAGLFFMLGTGLMATAGGGAEGNPFGTAAFGVGLGIVYVLMAILYIFPSLYLSRYASAIDRLLHSRRVPDLEEAIRQQKAFWRFVGILMVALFCLYGVGIVVAIVAGAALGGIFGN